MAILYAGGSITPVQAAPAVISLVESRDGALFYALPGRRLPSETWTH